MGNSPIIFNSSSFKIKGTLLNTGVGVASIIIEPIITKSHIGTRVVKIVHFLHSLISFFRGRLTPVVVYFLLTQINPSVLLAFKPWSPEFFALSSLNLANFLSIIISCLLLSLLGENHSSLLDRLLILFSSGLNETSSFLPTIGHSVMSVRL